MRELRIAIVAAALVIAAQVASATLYDAAAGFSTSANPNGFWEYGWSPTLGGTLTLDTDSIQNLGNVNGVVQWRGDQPPNADGNPSVFKNTTGSQQTIGSILMPNGALALHPGSAGQDSIVRFTAPTAGQYLISAAFSGLDKAGPTSTDVHVLVNSVVQFTAFVNGYGSGSSIPSSFSSTFTLSAGETVDFAVGYNGGSGQDANGPNFYYDSTRLQATVSAVPEPTTMIAGALLLLPFGASTLRILRRRTA
jgi:hypothetical protein